ncbi:MAG TPA: hypothetical protein VFK40_08115 [Nitrososphaeraceae archaeon]|nr:hypothetical protein [Nitrososphaeraceae archaeon]
MTNLTASLSCQVSSTSARSHSSMTRTYPPTYHILNYTTFYISINNRILIVSLYNAADELNIEDINTDDKEEIKLYSNFIY